VIDGLLEGLHRGVLATLGVVQLAQIGERVRHLAERNEDRLLLVQARLLRRRDGRAVGPERASGVQQRAAEGGGDSPDRRRAADERGDLGTRGAEQRGDVEAGKEVGRGDADGRVGGDQVLLGLAEARTPLERRWDDRLRVHRRAARNRPRRPPGQDADLVLLGRDLAFEPRDGGLRVAGRAERARHLELRRRPSPEAVLE
jgi:hypothetical protein